MEILTEQQKNQFSLLLQTLLEWNKSMNLTGITDPHEIEIKHFQDSLTVLPYIPSTAKTLIDVGTGAGFPGLVIAIMRPDIKVTLLEAAAKKVMYLEDVILKLALTNVQAIHGRAEDFAKLPEFRETFDIGTARAVAKLDTLSEYVLPFVKTGGVFIAQKKSGEEEIAEAKSAITLLGGTIESFHSVDNAELPDRQIILINKTSKTPDEYPRRAGVPLKKPL